jgi:hypothetical protein
MCVGVRVVGICSIRMAAMVATTALQSLQSVCLGLGRPWRTRRAFSVFSLDWGVAGHETAQAASAAFDDLVGTTYGQVETKSDQWANGVTGIELWTESELSTSDA